MMVVDLAEIEGRRYPAGRTTRNLVGGVSPLQALNFCIGYVTLDPEGGQVPWHQHDQEEVYLILGGQGEMCVNDERVTVSSGQAIFVPPGAFHQLTNTGQDELTLLYCYGPAGDVSHWREELDGTLPQAGVDAPPLPDGARRQHGSAGKRSG